LIDLHLHTTASDGQWTPDELVRRAAAVGITTLAVTDHDTVAALPAAQAEADRCGVRVVPGVEITAVLDGRDVHILGYFFDPDSPGLTRFLSAQRQDRVRRVREIAARLAAAACPIDPDEVLARAAAEGCRSVGRPQVSDALVRAGYVLDRREAFDRWLAVGRPGYVPRQGAAPSEVIALITELGGVTSLAHPGLLQRDDLIPALVTSGLAALEAYHCDHDTRTTARYCALARELDLAVSGGSDFHGVGLHRPDALGLVGLSAEEFEALQARPGGGGAPPWKMVRN
jgi:predicted metal-dependent phosphoesterase TrpH